MAEMRVALKLTADGSGLVAGVQAARGEVENLNQAAKECDTSWRRAMEGGSQAGTGLHKALNTASAANGELAGNTKLTTQQLLALQYTASDVAASLGSGSSPFTILLQQGGQLLQAFPNLIGRVAAVGAAAAAIGVPLAIVAERLSTITSETRELDVVLKAVGNRAGLTAQEIREMALAATEIGGTRAEAYEAALSLARDPRIKTPDLFREILKLAPDVAAVLGTTLPNAADALGEAFGEGAKGVLKLDEQLDFLTYDAAKQIETLDKQGKKSEALAIAVDALRQRFGGAAETMRGDWGNALHEAGRAWDAFVDRLAGSDVAQYVANKVKGAAQVARRTLEEGDTSRETQLRQEIARIDAQYNALPEVTKGVSATHEALMRRRIDLQRELNGLSKGHEEGVQRTGQHLYAASRNMKELAREAESVTAAFEFPADVVGHPDFTLVFQGEMQ